MPVERPDRTILAEGRFLRLVKSGRWELVERRNASGVVAIVAVTTDRRLVLIAQHRAPVDRIVVELPAGLVGDDPGQGDEAAQSAAQRELLEETGYAAPRWTLLTTGPSSAGLTSEVVALWHADGAEQVEAGGGVDGERIAVHAIPLADVPAFLRAQATGGALIDHKVWAGLWFIDGADQG